MPVLIALIIGGVAVAILEMRHQGISANLSASVSSGIPVYTPPTIGAPPQLSVGSSVVDDLSAQGEQTGLGLISNIPVVGGILSGIGGSLLAAHEQRLKDATSENQGAGIITQSFYDTIIQIVNAYNQGRISQSQAIQTAQQLDQQTFAKLRSLVGPPGTSWSTSSPGVCNKSCTVGCCIYNTWLHRDIYGGWPNPKRGLILTLQTGGTTAIAGIGSGGKYNFAGYPAQTLQIKAPNS